MKRLDIAAVRSPFDVPVILAMWLARPAVYAARELRGRLYGIGERLRSGRFALMALAVCLLPSLAHASGENLPVLTVASDTLSMVAFGCFALFVLAVIVVGAMGRGAKALLLVPLLASGCHPAPGVIAPTAAIVTVQTVDEGIAEFAPIYVSKDEQFGHEGIHLCQVDAGGVNYFDCVAAYRAPRMKPYLAVKTAIKAYRGSLAVGSALVAPDADGGVAPDLNAAIAGVISTLANVGISVVGGK